MLLVFQLGRWEFTIDLSIRQDRMIIVLCLCSSPHWLQLMEWLFTFHNFWTFCIVRILERLTKRFLKITISYLGVFSANKSIKCITFIETKRKIIICIILFKSFNCLRINLINYLFPVKNNVRSYFFAQLSPFPSHA